MRLILVREGNSDKNVVSGVFPANRGTIVNLDRVKEVRPWFAGDCIVVLKDATELRLSRRYRDRLEGLMGGEVG